MKKLLIAGAVALLLAGCQTTDPKVEPSVIIVNKYLIPDLGPEATAIPDPVPRLDLSTATQADVANWLVEREKRVSLLESKLGTVGKASEALIIKKELKEGDYIILNISKELSLTPPPVSKQP